MVFNALIARQPYSLPDCSKPILLLLYIPLFLNTHFRLSRQISQLIYLILQYFMRLALSVNPSQIPDVLSQLNSMPTNFDLAYDKLGINSQAQMTYICCRKCYTLYYPDTMMPVMPISLAITNSASLPYQSWKYRPANQGLCMYQLRADCQPCNEPLLVNRGLNTPQTLPPIPSLSFTYPSLTAFLAKMVTRPGMANLLASSIPHNIGLTGDNNGGTSISHIMESRIIRGIHDADGNPFRAIVFGVENPVLVGSISLS